MPETPEERSRRLKAARQRRWRLRKEMPEPGTAVAVPAAADDTETVLLPDHMRPFGALAEIGVLAYEEARRYSEHVRGLGPAEALVPVKAGSSPPAAEARLQRESAVRALSAMAMTPVAAMKVLRDRAMVFDLASELMAAEDGRPNRLASSTIGPDGLLIPGPLVPADWTPDDDD